MPQACPEKDHSICCNQNNFIFGRPSHAAQLCSKNFNKNPCFSKRDKIIANIKRIPKITIISKKEEKPSLNFNLVPPEKITFGRPNRPSTPIFDLLQNNYARIWLKEREEFKLKLQKEKRKKMVELCKNSRSTLLMQHKCLSGKRPDVAAFSKDKYPKVESHLDTFRSEEERKRSLCASREVRLPAIVEAIVKKKDKKKEVVVQEKKCSF